MTRMPGSTEGDRERPRGPVDTVQRLRRHINDLAVLAALPAVWCDLEPRRIAEQPVGMAAA